jgi:hypothetical protein
VHRQQKIADGHIKATTDNLIGVNFQAAEQTINTVPYLTHLDYVRAVKELTEIADYLVINLALNVNSAGIRQYY